jgi:acid stress chaperone HdeB
MRLSTLALAAAVGLAGVPARAQDIDMSTIKCKDFVAASKDEIGTILTWLEGYYTGEDDPPIFHADKTVSDAKKLSEYCAAHGDAGLITAAEAVMPVKK